MKNIGEKNLYNLKDSYRFRKSLLCFLFIYIIFKLVLSYLSDGFYGLFISFIELIILIAGSTIASLFYQIIIHKLFYIEDYKNKYKDKLEQLQNNYTKLDLLRAEIETTHDIPSLLSYIDNYYNYAIITNLYDAISLKYFNNLMNNFISNFKLISNSKIKTKKIAKILLNDLIILNKNAILRIEYQINEGKKLDKENALIII